MLPDHLPQAFCRLLTPNPPPLGGLLRAGHPRSLKERLDQAPSRVLARPLLGHLGLVHDQGDEFVANHIHGKQCLLRLLVVLRSADDRDLAARALRGEGVTEQERRHFIDERGTRSLCVTVWHFGQAERRVNQTRLPSRKDDLGRVGDAMALLGSRDVQATFRLLEGQPIPRAVIVGHLIVSEKVKQRLLARRRYQAAGATLTADAVGTAALRCLGRGLHRLGLVHLTGLRGTLFIHRHRRTGKLDSLSEDVLLAQELLVGVMGDQIDLVDVRHPGALPKGEPEPTAQNLLGERLGGEFAQCHNHRNVLHVPALSQHVHADDCSDG
ncbi:hypothetical protein FM114_10480 [Luteococcus japonicus LSP_Lj1]|uniref:Uncharacterized protein n=1 Tax=Luteococcus japonicus LSP_Lj1 TaxID=1255658 RepID=A0A1R4JZ74_9ACTN|nr:hypothetical protein FM114_10480 [Luteococcus japonicus LSP_Lj1]